MAFDGPVLAQEPDDIEVWNERVKVTCSHNADRKRYEAHVSWCKAAQRNGFSIEQVAIFTDPYVLLFHSEPVGRYSDNKFEAFCANVRDLCVTIVNDETDVRDVAELLRKAVSYSLVKN
jgi:hypothetical protein